MIAKDFKGPQNILKDCKRLKKTGKGFKWLKKIGKESLLRWKLVDKDNLAETGNKITKNRYSLGGRGSLQLLPKNQSAFEAAAN